MALIFEHHRYTEVATMRMTLAQYLECEQRLARGRSKKHDPDLGAVAPRSAESSPPRALDNGSKKRESGASCVEYRVSLVACRHRLLDPDAVAFSFKPLTDEIAAWLGVDDADPRVDWEWSQIKTGGTQGVLVKIETISLPETDQLAALSIE